MEEVEAKGVWVRRGGEGGEGGVGAAVGAGELVAERRVCDSSRSLSCRRVSSV